MKGLIALFVMQLPAIILCGGSIWLASNAKDGWGWMLFVAVLIAVPWSKVV